MKIEFIYKQLLALSTISEGASVVKVAMADDHTMLRQGLANMIESFGDYKVTLQASNGKELIQHIDPLKLPDVALLDISMPEMNGFETAAYLHQHYPSIKVLAVSMMDNETAIIRMIKNGARGYVLKDAEPSELRQALYDVVNKGYYYSDLVTGKLIFNMNRQGADEQSSAGRSEHITDKELEFLKYVCTELTYKEIADRMHVSPRTVDGYRDVLFEKLGVKTRTGLAMYVVKRGLVEL
jgi:two-component system invasion response regulator UvrY